MRASALARAFRPVLSGTPPFHPLLVPNVAGWWDGSVLPGADADAISSWTDLSGLGRHLVQGTPAVQPQLKLAIQNGRSVVRFDGAGDRMACGFVQAQTHTRFIVCRYRSAWTANEVCFDGAGALNASLYRVSSTGMKIYAGAAESTTLTTTPESWHLYEATFAGASSVLMVDGGSSVSGVNIGTATSGGVQIGADGSGGQSADVDVGEALTVNGDVAAGYRTLLRAYFKTKWALP